VQGGEHRVLNDHQFIQPVNGLSAFTNTSFEFLQGVGVYSFRFPSIFQNGALYDARLFLYNQLLFAQIGIENRVSIDLAVQGFAGVGGDLDTIVGVGALALLSAGAMPKVRIVTLDEIGLQISAGAGIRYDRQVAVLPVVLIDKALAELDTEAERDAFEDSVITHIGTLSLAPAVMAAWGYKPVGVQLSVAPELPIAHEAPDGYDTPSAALALDGHLAFDVHRLTRRVPVALTFEGSVDLDFGDRTTTTTTLGGGVYYSGRRDFELGLTGSVVLYQDADLGDPTLTYGAMVMHYYF
jgi:hypothetical protein